MRFTALFMLAGLAGLAVAPAQAQAQRHVLLEVCNETGFRVATAAVYASGPAPSRTLRTWFLIDPGTCLDGALDGVTGDTVQVHVMSGEWRWPARGADAVWCVPASGETMAARAEPCRDGQQARGFRRLPVEATSRRGPGGIYMGRVGWRIRCDDLVAEDAHLCLEAPVDARGLAQPVRTLEVCNLIARDIDLALFEVRPDGNFALLDRPSLAGGACADLYRGFPATGEIMVGEIGVFHERQEGRLCVPLPQGEMPADPSPDCAPNEADTGIRIHRFGERTSRFTAYVGR